MVFPNINELTWNQFCSMPGIDKLPLNEQARQYQLYCEEIAQFKYTYSNAAPTGGGGASQIQEEVIPSNCFQYVVNTTNNADTDFSVTSNGVVNATINWGDGTTEVVEIDTSNTILHTYAEQGPSYTVRVCFDLPENVTELNFFS